MKTFFKLTLKIITQEVSHKIHARFDNSRKSFTVVTFLNSLSYSVYNIHYSVKPDFL